MSNQNKGAEAASKAKKTSGTKTTELILGAGAAKIVAAVKSLKETIIVVDQLQEKIDNGVLEVMNLEDKVGALQQKLKNDTEQNRLEIQQAYKNDEKSFVDKWLQGQSMTAILTTDLTKLKDDLSAATTKMQDTVNAEVGKAKAIEKANSENAIKIANLEHEKKEASNTAEIAQLKAQIKFLESQLQNATDLLKKQMEQETERAKHGAINTLNVGGTTQGR